MKAEFNTTVEFRFIIDRKYEKLIYDTIRDLNNFEFLAHSHIHSRYQETTVVLSMELDASAVFWFKFGWLLRPHEIELHFLD